jgi:hypothetical protein
MPGEPYPAETRERALDLVAAEAAANGGTVPHGAYARAGRKTGVDKDLIWKWWNWKTDDEDKEARCSEFARLREQQRDEALDLSMRILRGLSLHLTDEAFGVADQVKLLAALQKIVDGSEGGEALQQINLLINHGDLKILDEPPPPPKLPDGMVIEATDDGD